MTDFNIFACDIDSCNKVFKARKSLKDHILIHKGEKPYNCNFEFCDKKFTQFSSLQKHERIHKGEKPYMCDEEECHLSFTQISNLKRHKRIHTNEKPFICKECLKKFNTTSNLKQHEKTHFSQDIRAKFKCSECQKTYFHISSLKKHSKFHKTSKFENNNSSKIIHPLIFHNNHYDFLINGYLYYLEKDNHFDVHELEESHNNPIQCKPIDDKFHREDIKKLAEIYKKIVTNIVESKNNSEKDEEPKKEEFFILKEDNKIFDKNENNDIFNNTLMPQEENILFISNIKDNTENNELEFNEKINDNLNECKKCIGNITKNHIHGIGCGHSIIFHKGHIDYLVDDNLHHPHNEHCDDHGNILLVEIKS